MRYKKPITPDKLLIQRIRVSDKFPGFKYFRKSHDIGYWIGKLQPTPESETYTVKIVYNKYRSPNVYVLKPKLMEKCPHIYLNKSLCLYYPRDYSHNPDSMIADTIIPWTSEWLYFYEGWLKEGIWWGEEAPHHIPIIQEFQS